MSRVVSSYESILRGVSQQPPHARRPGQMAEQVNLVSDPVRGLCRRRGSLFKHQISIAGAYASIAADAKKYRTLKYTTGGVNYSVAYRTGASTGPIATVMDRDSSVVLPTVIHSDSVTSSLLSGGVSAITAVGRFLLFAGHDIVPTETAHDRLEDPASKKAVVWIRGGVHGRTFKLKIVLSDGTPIEVSYTTPAAAYPGALDTSDILYSSPTYTKDVNDRVNAYNSAVTEWISSSSLAIQPENIAEELSLAITTALTPYSIPGPVTVDDHLCFDLALTGILSVSASDGGNGEFVRVVDSVISAAELVSRVHYPGKVVAVRPSSDADAIVYYLEAVALADGSTGFTPVRWQECAGVQQTPTTVFAIGTVHGGSLHIAGTGAALEAATGVETPSFQSSTVGDLDTCPVPAWVGSKITYMTVFQDRLIICSGAVAFASRVGDYFNWYRRTVLSVLDNDPVEAYALGADDDVITGGELYDRSLILFGKKRQYALNGKSVLSPKAPLLPVVSAHTGTDAANPETIGNRLLYLARHGSDSTSMHQFQPGVNVESPEAYSLSAQLDSYLVGDPVELCGLTEPNFVFVRTSGFNGVYVYQFVDTPNGERVLDSWHKWSFHPDMGTLMSISTAENMLYMLFLRNIGGTCYLAMETLSRDSTELVGYPYLDSIRNYGGALVVTSTANLKLANGGGVAAAMIGGDYSDAATLVVDTPELVTTGKVGYSFDSYVTPTNPYVRDQDGRAKLEGRLTLGRVFAVYSDTTGLRGYVTHAGTENSVAELRQVYVGGPGVLGELTEMSGELSVPVGRNIEECSYRLASEQWYPMRITSLRWVGQYFNNSRRV